MCVTDHNIAQRHGRTRGDDFLVIDGIEVVALDVRDTSLGLVVSLKRLMTGLLPKGAIVFAARLDKRSILGALRRGHFYSSTGPVIYDVKLSEGRLTVRTSPVTIARLVGYNGYHRTQLAGKTAPLGGDASRPFVSITFPLPSDQAVRAKFRYVRFECEDERTGKKAWTNALFRRE